MANIKDKIVEILYDIDKKVHLVITNDGNYGTNRFMEFGATEEYKQALELMKAMKNTSQGDIEKLEEHISRF